MFLWWRVLCADVFLLRYWLYYIRALQHFIRICIIKLLFRCAQMRIRETLLACVSVWECIFACDICTNEHLLSRNLLINCWYCSAIPAVNGNLMSTNSMANKIVAGVDLITIPTNTHARIQPSTLTQFNSTKRLCFELLNTLPISTNWFLLFIFTFLSNRIEL